MTGEAPHEPPRATPATGAADTHPDGKDAAVKAMRRRMLIAGFSAGTIATALALWFTPGATWWFYPFVFVVSGTAVARLASGMARTKGIMDEV